MQKLQTGWKWLSTGALVVVAALSLLTLAGGATQAQDSASTGPVNSISVTGFGEVSGTPDVAYINLGSDTVSPDVGTAVEQANADLNAIVAAISETGVAPEDIQTVNFNVWPEDRFDPSTGQPTGERVYHVQNTINVTVRDIAQTGAVIDAGLNAGADTINGLSFGIADTSELEQQARLNAVEDARTRAGQLAGAFGVTVGDPIIISETLGGGVVFPQFGRDMAVGLGGASQISPGQLSVSVTINVTFAINR